MENLNELKTTLLTLREKAEINYKNSAAGFDEGYYSGQCDALDAILIILEKIKEEL